MPHASRSLRLRLGVAGFVLAFGLGGYVAGGGHEGWSVGPGDSGAAAAEAVQAAQIAAMVGRLERRLKTQPDDAEGWAMLARSYAALGRDADAAPAWRRLAALRPQDAQALADAADGLALAHHRSLLGEPEALALRAVRLDPGHVKALVLAGTAAFQRNDPAGAAALWQRALGATDLGGDLRRQLQAAVAEARRRAGRLAPAGAAVAGAGGAEPATLGATAP